MTSASYNGVPKKKTRNKHSKEHGGGGGLADEHMYNNKTMEGDCKVNMMR